MAHGFRLNGFGISRVAIGNAVAGVLVRFLKQSRRADGLPDDTEEAEDEPDPKMVRDPKVFINPVITWESEDLSIYNEGCLSVPDMYADVDRPARIRVNWLDEQGAKFDAELDGLLATCLQHEMDHLEGVLFIDHLSKLKRGMLLKKLEKARRSAA